MGHPFPVLGRDKGVGRSLPALGTAMEGGFFVGVAYIGEAGSRVPYMLILGPVTGGQGSYAYKTTDTASVGASDPFDGAKNTTVLAGLGNHPAATWAEDRPLGGYTDWYLPSRNELQIGLLAQDQLPIAVKFSSGFYYWSSTSGSDATTTAQSLRDTDFSTAVFAKSNSLQCRIMRKIPVLVS